MNDGTENTNLTEAKTMRLTMSGLMLVGAFAAFAPEQANATEVMVTVTAMLKAVNLQVFELGMWQAWSGKR